jgi:CheY-like chemotaxis protein
VSEDTRAQEAQYFFALVDDEPRIHEFLVQVLREEGLMEQHASFYDPVSFLDYLQTAEEEPDIVLLDIHFENSGLSGVDILPHIREEFPFLPIILLTGMDSDAIKEAEDYQCTYFIPKPVSPEHLSKMIRFYMGKSRKSSDLLQNLTHELKDYREYQQLLEEEIESLQSAPRKEPKTSKGKSAREKSAKAFQRIHDLLSSILQNSEIMPSFIKDLEGVFDSQYDVFKKVIETLLRFDVMDMSNPGLNIHKYKGTDNVYSARLSRKARIFFYSAPHLSRRRLLRLDTQHDTKGMDRWLKENYQSYAD